MAAEELKQSVACFRGVLRYDVPKQKGRTDSLYRPTIQIRDATRTCPSHVATLLRNCLYSRALTGHMFWRRIKSVAEIEKVILDRSVWRHEGVKANQLTVSHSTKGIKRDRPTYCIKTPLAKQFHLRTLRHHFRSAEPPTSSNVFPLWQSSSYRTIMMKQFNIPSTISGSIVDFHVHHSFRFPNAFRSFCRLAPKTYDHIWSHVVSDDLPHDIPATCQVDKMCPKEARLSEQFWRSSSWRVCWSKAVSNLRTTQGYLVIVDIFVC